MQHRPVIACAGLLAGALVALSGNAAQAASTRYEAENSPAVCTGTIDSHRQRVPGPSRVGRVGRSQAPWR